MDQRCEHVDKASEEQADEPSVDVDLIEEDLLMVLSALQTTNEAGNVRGDANDKGEHRSPIDSAIGEQGMRVAVQISEM